MIFLLESPEAALSSGNQIRGSLLGRGLWIGLMLVSEKAWATVSRVLKVSTGPSWGDLMKLYGVAVGVLGSNLLEA